MTLRDMDTEGMEEDLKRKKKRDSFGEGKKERKGVKVLKLRGRKLITTERKGREG